MQNLWNYINVATRLKWTTGNQCLQVSKHISLVYQPTAPVHLWCFLYCDIPIVWNLMLTSKYISDITRKLSLSLSLLLGRVGCYSIAIKQILPRLLCQFSVCKPLRVMLTKQESTLIGLMIKNKKKVVETN